MPEISTLKDRYPEINGILGYCHIHGDGIQLDGHFSGDELRRIADFAEKLEADFEVWYAKCLEIKPELGEATNLFYHRFCAGLSPFVAVTKE